MTRGGTGCDCPDVTECLCTFADSDCIIFDGTGTALDPISARPDVDPAADNMLECRASGFYVTLPTLIKEPPRGAARRSTTLAVASGVESVVTFTSEIYDSAGMVNIASNPARVSITETGLYIVQATVVWEEPVAAAFASASVYSMPSDTNVATDARYITLAPGTPAPRLSITGEEELDDATYLEVRLFQNTGSSLNCTGVTLSARYVAPQV